MGLRVLPSEEGGNAPKGKKVVKTQASCGNAMGKNKSSASEGGRGFYFPLGSACAGKGKRHNLKNPVSHLTRKRKKGKWPSRKGEPYNPASGEASRGRGGKESPRPFLPFNNRDRGVRKHESGKRILL